MVQKAIEQRGGDDGIAEDVTPFGEAAVGGEDHGALLVSGIDELEEEIATAGNDRQVADLVYDQEGCSAEIAQALPELTFAFRCSQRGDDIGENGEVDTSAGFDGFDRERRGEMALAGSGRTKEMHHFGSVDEGEFGEREDALPVERGLEREVKAGERLDCGEASQRQRCLDAAALANRQFLDQELIEGFDAIDLASFDTADVASSTSNARGIRSATRLCLMLSRVVGATWFVMGALPRSRGARRRPGRWLASDARHDPRSGQ